MAADMSEELAKSRWAPQGSDKPSSVSSTITTTHHQHPCGHGGTKNNRHGKKSHKSKPTGPPQPATATTTTTTTTITATAPANSTLNGASTAPNTNPKIWTPSPRPALSNGTALTSTSPTQQQQQQQQQQQRAARLPRVVGGVSSSLGDGWEKIPTHPEPTPEPSSCAPSLRSESQSPPKTQKKRPIPPSIADAVEALSRYRKIRRRLEWKLRHLVDGFKQATNRDQPATEQLYAEQMFKLDFHEYYGLLERALVYLMLVWNIHVSRAHPSTSTSAKISWADEMNGGGSGTHRYHANVLEALRDLDSPYFEVLGSGDRFAHLQKAKELRNRWKYADRDPEERERDPQTWRAGYKAWKDALTPLESYDFDTIFVQILQGLVEAADIAQLRVDELGREAGQDDAAAAAAAAGGSESDPDEWDFLVDAMDWEAV